MISAERHIGNTAASIGQCMVAFFSMTFNGLWSLWLNIRRSGLQSMLPSVGTVQVRIRVLGHNNMYFHGPPGTESVNIRDDNIDLYLWHEKLLHLVGKHCIIKWDGMQSLLVCVMFQTDYIVYISHATVND